MLGWGCWLAYVHFTYLLEKKNILGYKWKIILGTACQMQPESFLVHAFLELELSYMCEGHWQVFLTIKHNWISSLLLDWHSANSKMGYDDILYVCGEKKSRMDNTAMAFSNCK